MKRRHFIPLLVPVLALAENGGYEERNIEGWTVVVSRNLLKKEQNTAAAAISLLQTKLQDVVSSVPEPAVTELRTVRIWMEYPADGVAKCAAYHPSEKWLMKHGHNPAKARCVEFGNAELFLKWSETQPSMVLHELAHAFHHQALTYSYQPIIDAYKQALANNLYAEIKHANGKNQRAYALNNEKEFFSELTEAYFGQNDMFPFVRNQLKEYDPTGFEMIKSAWKA